MSSKSVRVASIYFHPTDYEENKQKIESICKEAAQNGAKIIVLPEFALTGVPNMSEKENLGLAEEIPNGPILSFLSKIAKELQVYICASLLEIDYPSPQFELDDDELEEITSLPIKKEGTYYNSVCLISKNGKIMGHLRKELDKTSTNTNIKYISGNKNTKTAECCATEYGVIAITVGNNINYHLEEQMFLKSWLLLWSTSTLNEHKNDLSYKLNKIGTIHLISSCSNFSSSLETSAIYLNDGTLLSSSSSSETPIIYGDLPYYPFPESIQTTSTKTVKVASVQVSSDMGTLKRNSRKIRELAKEAARAGAKIIVFPEAALTGYLSQDILTNWHLEGWPIALPFSRSKDPAPYAVRVPSDITNEFCQLSKELNVYIALPFVEIDDSESRANPKYYNTVILLSPLGEIVAHYRKNNPWPHPEKSWATAGNDVACYNTEYGKVGLAICFDIHEMPEKYKPHDIWTLLYPIAWVDGRPLCVWYHTYLPERLSKFDFHVVGANWSVDKYQSWYGYGCSTIYEEGGKILSTAESVYGSEVIYADLPYK